MSKKKIVFLAVTNSENTEDRVYSDYVLNQCKTALSNDVSISSAYDVEEFKRHDMMNHSSLEKGIVDLIQKSDYYIILIDCFNGNYCPNVWFELGVLAITSQKPMIFIAQQSMHSDYPFYIRNIANVLLFPKVTIVNNKGKNVIDDYQIDNEHMKKFKNKFVEQFCSSKNSPFEMFSDTFHLALSGYKDLRELEAKLSEIANRADMAEYIDGEERAFSALCETVSKAEYSLRTTRFANESIIHTGGVHISINDPVQAAHNEFMKAIYQASRRIADNCNNKKNRGVVYRCDRIVCNNSPEKWNDIYYALLNSDDIMNVYVRKSDYSINFELVIVDEKIAFIHFYQTNRSGHNNSNIQKIKSTLKISDQGVCMELSKVFDRLHHRDFDDKCSDLSRTLLGVENDTYNSGQPEKYGFFSMANRPENTSRKDYIKDQFLNALMNWNFPKDNISNESRDKVNMAVGYIRSMRVYDINLFFERVNFSEEEKKSIRQILHLGD